MRELACRMPLPLSFTEPNGSGQSIGNSKPEGLTQKIRFLMFVDFPNEFDADRSRKYCSSTRSIFAAIFNGIPTDRAI